MKSLRTFVWSSNLPCLADSHLPALLVAVLLKTVASKYLSSWMFQWVTVFCCFVVQGNISSDCSMLTVYCVKVLIGSMAASLERLSINDIDVDTGVEKIDGKDNILSKISSKLQKLCFNSLNLTQWTSKQLFIIHNNTRISTSRLAVLTGGCGDGPGSVPTELHSRSRSTIIDFSACQSQPRGDSGKWQVLVYFFHSKWESGIPWDCGLGFSTFLSIGQNLATIFVRSWNYSKFK